MAVPSIRSNLVRDAKDIFGKISQSNHYEVSFSSLKTPILEHIKTKFGTDLKDFTSRKAGLLCSDASLPTSGFATAETKGDFIGIPQEFAHTRLYTDIDFTFYVDDCYENIILFEGWIDYISSGSETEEDDLSYYRRFRFPEGEKGYKIETMYITKFEKSYNKTKRKIYYQFKNVFPKTMTSIPVSYGPADLLKVNVTFNYDRYIMNYKGNNSKPSPNEFDTNAPDLLSEKQRLSVPRLSGDPYVDPNIFPTSAPRLDI
jgi:hypothetical protein